MRTGGCLQEGAYRRVCTAGCVQQGVYSRVRTAGCVQEGAYRRVRTAGCVQEGAYRDSDWYSTDYKQPVICISGMETLFNKACIIAVRNNKFVNKSCHDI